VTAVEAPAPGAEALVDRIVESVVGTMDLFGIYLGHRLGYYRALADGGPATSAELASRTGTAERYAREWLEQQAVTGILEATPGDAASRCYSLPETFVEVLVDEMSAAFLAPMAQMAAACFRVGPEVVEAFRTGGGVSREAFGDDGREGQAAINRPYFGGALVSDDLPSIPGIGERLRAGEALTIADVGCGLGWSSIEIARAFPSVRVDGFDLDTASIVRARTQAEGDGLDDRVAFFDIDAAAAPGAGTYDLVTAFECIHDMPNPVEVLATMRRVAAPGGTVVVMDERVADEFAAPGDLVERMMYGWSIACCLPAGMTADGSSAATGTVMRLPVLEAYAKQAGFAGVEVLDIENDFFRFYRLV